MVFSLKTRNFTSLLTYVFLDYPVPVETDLLKVTENLLSETESSPPIIAIRILKKT